MRTLLLLALLAAPAAAVEPPEQKLFPRSFELFEPLRADPRQIQVGAYYYRLKGENMGDVALGHSWGMARWLGRGWLWQWDVEGMAYTRFQVSGDINKMQAIDFEANSSWEAARGPLSAKLSLYHISSHLGDDYIRDTNDRGFRYSTEGVRLLGSWRPIDALRLYGGGGGLFHAIPEQRSGQFQTGLEARSKPFKLGSASSRVYVAGDLQWKHAVRWNMTGRVVAGLRAAIKEGARAMKFHLGYQEGHSAFGQRFTEREHQADVGITFEL